MLFGNREPRSLVARRRGWYRPAVRVLETRVLMAASGPIDLGGGVTTGLPINPAIASIPYGIAEAGTVSNGGAGFSVTDVGDLTGSGYDDFVVGAPTVNRAAGVVDPISAASPGGVYVILGSATTNGGSISRWLNIPTTPGNSNADPQPGDQRVGDLAQLGNASGGSGSGQANPITGSQSYPFAGFKLQTLSEPGSQLGVSVAKAGVINGRAAFLIGAPGAADLNGQNPGTGRAYLIFGGANLTTLASSNLAPIDLDAANQNSGLNFITFVNSAVNGQTGRSVAGIGDVFGGGTNNIAIGAPGVTVNGNVAAGDTYIVPSGLLQSGASVIQLNTLGQGNNPGIQITGTATGDNVGFSVAGLGGVQGAIAANTGTRISDFVIGAPNANGGTGAAYVFYGEPNLAGRATVVGTGLNALRQLQVTQVGASGGTVAGFSVLGAAVGDQTGFSVASAGDFNGDGFNDVLVGSPGANAAAGRVDLFYGAPFNAGPISGPVTLGAVPTSVQSVAYTGANPGDLAGWAVGSMGAITTNPIQNPGNPILIGAPGYTGGSGQGTVYLIPSNFVPGQTFRLSTAIANPSVQALQFIFSTPGSISPPFFGASLGAYQPDILTNTPLNTADGDSIPDFIIGAPGYGAPGQNGLNQRGLDGGVFVVEGAFIAPLLGVPTPITQLTSQIDVDSLNGPPFTISATTPDTLIIYVFSNSATSPRFNPVTSLDPTTVTVNGIPFPNATLSADPTDENGDGIPDAIITITPRSSLNLLSTTSTFSLTAKTLANSPFAGARYSSSTSIIVTGGIVPPGGGGGGGGGSTAGVSTPIGQAVPTSFLGAFGPDIFTPSVTTLSQLDTYKPIPARAALRQYLPGPGFEQRLFYYQHPGQKPENQFGYSGGDGYHGHRSTQLGSKVFTHSAYKHGKTVEFKHRVPVIPANLQHEQLAGPIAGVTQEPAHAKASYVKPVVHHARKR